MWSKTLSDLIRDERGSTYAWLLFFVGAFVFSLIFYYAMSPLWKWSLTTAELNNITDNPGASEFYMISASIYRITPFLFLILLTIGLLKYASDIKKTR